LRRIRKSRGHYVVPRNNITLHNTTLTGVPLQQNGDFVIDDVLTPVPSTCASPGAPDPQRRGHLHFVRRTEDIRAGLGQLQGLI
jgi:hypothetical protein